MPVLIRNGYVVTMNAARDVFDGGWVLVGEDGRIDGVGPASQCPSSPAANVVDARGMIVIPGLVDAHHHHWHNLLMLAVPAGQPSDPSTLRDFAAWHFSPQMLGDSARIAAHTLLRAGTTCSLNHLPPGCDDAAVGATVEAFSLAGARLVQAVEMRCGDVPQSESERLAHLVDRWHGSAGDRVRIAVEVATSAVATLRGQASEEMTSAAHRLATQRGLRVVTRTSAADAAGSAEYHQALRVLGRSEVMHLMELGAIDSHWLLQGGELLNATDVALMRESGCSAAYSPLSEAMGGLGWGPWTELRRCGVPCALGSGTVAQHGGIDMVQQMKASVLIQNTVRLDATAMSAEAALEMATIDGARALGLGDEIGSLEAGKRADIALFDLRGIQMQVGHKPVSVFVTCATGKDATWVMVDGRWAVRHGRVCEAADAGPWMEAGRRHAASLRDLWAATAAGG